MPPVVANLTILFLAANPADTTQLQLDEELRAVDEALRKSEFRDRFDLRSAWAVRYSDLQELLLRYQPHIVHFSGRGNAAGEIVLQDAAGAVHPIAPDTLAELFAILKDNLRCVVLNACYSDKQAHGIAKSIDCVAGTTRAVKDLAAIDFAAAFYLGLGYGRSVQTAFDLGRNRIGLAGLESDDWAPKLVVKRGVHARQVVLVHDSDAPSSPQPLPATITQTRRIDAALPATAAQGTVIDLLVKVALPDSPQLAPQDFPPERVPEEVRQRSESVGLEFPVEPTTGKIGKGQLEIRVLTDEFDVIDSSTKKLKVPPDQDSQLVKFLLRARQLGRCHVNVEVYDETSLYLGTAALEAAVVGETAGAVPLQVASLTLSLEVWSVPGAVEAVPTAGAPPEPAAPRAGKSGRRWLGSAITILAIVFVGATTITTYRQAEMRRDLQQLAIQQQLSMQLTQPMVTLSSATLMEDHTEFPTSSAVARKTSVPPASSTTYVATTTAVRSQTTTRTNPIDGAVYVFVTGGPFTMGSSDSDELAQDDERPPKSIPLDAFWLKQTEVTNAEYVRCVNDNRACSEPASPRWNDPVFANYPVTGVDWYQVMQYARWAGGRLPTEAEWEKACRGADGRIYPWGDRAPTPDLANSNATDAKPVGSYPGGATPYGALDLAGNVAEWTSTQYRAYPYAADDGRENVEVEADRVLRGGSFATDVVRCAVRDYDGPNDRSNVIGFRVVLDK